MNNKFNALLQLEKLAIKMKSKLQIILMFAAIAVVFVCADTSFAQMVGGYKSTAVDNVAVIAAADFAVSDHSEKNDVSLYVVKIKKAERQVVQGTNFRMCVEVGLEDEGNEDNTQFVLMTVYQDLKRKYKVTSWKPNGCGQ